mmetsp:Transcript_49492/g.155749  ORF Transcript_49492/g.155749 Transcript_49492/m.155749 type:complete len:215 (-) Transcript_49492:164-808(-)
MVEVVLRWDGVSASRRRYHVWELRRGGMQERLAPRPMNAKHPPIMGMVGHRKADKTQVARRLAHDGGIREEGNRTSCSVPGQLVQLLVTSPTVALRLCGVCSEGPERGTPTRAAAQVQRHERGVGAPGSRAARCRRASRGLEPQAVPSLGVELAAAQVEQVRREQCAMLSESGCVQDPVEARKRREVAVEDDDLLEPGLRQREGHVEVALAGAP